ncbi:hypothetical protein NL108_000542 [Boleophthalmus pectinirostris]|uniref:C-C motif chemokine 19-like n=1 Tax=Boleophthalmus pectinirostris TaxID=150288 RepID=UPI00242EBF2E|nr:C-C motif chemokine 19-like [Boleophthalmus pectinirostris]KAJ0058819.1 hypothetical protein NL108_000542 [Boleophthalmus pectinirostris]
MSPMSIITATTILLCLTQTDSAREKVSVPGAQGCCMSYTRSPVPFHRIIGVKTQSAQENCDLDAIIFETVKKNKICADIRDAWVRRILNMLSERLKKLATKDIKESPVARSSRSSFSTTESSQNITESFYNSSSFEALV